MMGIINTPHFAAPPCRTQELGVGTMKLYRHRTLAGFVYFSHRDSAQAEWKVERDFCAPSRRYTVCRLEVGTYQDKRVWADWYVQYDAVTLNDARDFIASEMRLKTAAPAAALVAASDDVLVLSGKMITVEMATKMTRNETTSEGTV